MYLAVKKVKPVDGYKLIITFENQEKRCFDVSPYLEIGKRKKMEQLVKTISLENNLTLELFDASKKIAGDRWQVTLVARMAVPVDEAISKTRLDPAKAAEIRQVLENTAIYETKKQRNFIDNREKAAVFDQLMDTFLTYSRPYLSHPDFAGRFVLKTFNDRQKQRFSYPKK